MHNRTSQSASSPSPQPSAAPASTVRTAPARRPHPLRLPTPETRELRFADLTAAECDGFFGAFEATVPAGLA